MRYVPIQHVKAESFLAKPLINDNGHILLKAGAQLNESLIQKIQRMGFLALYIKDEHSQHEIEDVIEAEVRQKATKSLQAFLEGSIDTRKMSTNDMKNLQNKEEEVKSVVKAIIDDLFLQKDIVMNMVDIKKVDDYTYGHCVNVMLLSVMVGIGANMNKQQLYDLAIGSLMHDVGKLFIPKEILLKPSGLTNDEYIAIQQHTTKGFEWLKNYSEFSAPARSVSLQHHERVDGRGYPNGLKEKDIHIYSKITSITDVYDALTSDRYYRRALPAKEAIEYILGGGGQYFSIDLTRIFAKKVNPYPLGTLVRINGGMVGVVEVINNENFQRPIVKILQEKGVKVTPWLCDLYKERNLVIESIIFSV
ncbi:HD-GYP domain-containing protein [Alkaliphilus hydrothermalis]|uniref:HD-GYP domain-containing protein (C-di-GMP phosphodiesterase class II) n=1 Tax=Alkaliphilus hydrothermalis TaxID=1482730 RepID=A0ABS2NRE5_9FIRM|nr:HD-GYP domain-containing protein [Alkaliphilus hydrothermalis]MBM7615144.1 HD-GYP domain-containing protein (c-di-GMP phosphodiesterase class II) [Alkaliphilus hydrothermalis]